MVLVVGWLRKWSSGGLISDDGVDFGQGDQLQRSLFGTFHLSVSVSALSLSLSLSSLGLFTLCLQDVMSDRLSTRDSVTLATYSERIRDGVSYRRVRLPSRISFSGANLKTVSKGFSTEHSSSWSDWTNPQPQVSTSTSSTHSWTMAPRSKETKPHQFRSGSSKPLSRSLSFSFHFPQINE